MRVGRRFFRFWIYLFLATGTGCAGCGNCFDIGPVGGCDLGFGCDGGDCFDSYESDSGPNYCSSGDCDASYPSGQSIRTGLRAPQGVVSDGVDVIFVDDGTLMRVDPDGSEPLVLATGVDASGGLATNGVEVFWSGGWSGTSADGGADASDDGGDAGDDVADAGDDGGDAGDAGDITVATSPGIYAVPVIGGDVRIVGSLPALPTLAIDDTHAYARTLADDAGSSTLNAYGLDGDAGLAPLATLGGNTENLHAFVPRASDVVALDRSDIVAVPFDGGAPAVLVSDAGSIGLFATTAGVVTLSNDAIYSRIGFVGADAQATPVATVGDLGVVASFGNYIYFFVPVANAIARIDVTNPADVSSLGVTDVSVLYLAADANNVYWMTAGPSGALYAAPVR